MLVVIEYGDIIGAADDVVALLEHRPDSIEGLDARLVDAVREGRGGVRRP